MSELKAEVTARRAAVFSAEAARRGAEQLINAFNLLIEIEIVRCVPKPYFLNLDALTMTMMRLIFKQKVSAPSKIR